MKTRVNVSLDAETLELLDRIVRELGIRNRSAAVAYAAKRLARLELDAKSEPGPAQ